MIVASAIDMVRDWSPIVLSFLTLCTYAIVNRKKIASLFGFDISGSEKPCVTGSGGQIRRANVFRDLFFSAEFAVPFTVLCVCLWQSLAFAFSATPLTRASVILVSLVVTLGIACTAWLVVSVVLYVVIRRFWSDHSELQPKP